jgi:rSAM/selenodomain-associated transferase 2
MLSVVVPTLNAAATLPACLAAVDEADEIVVVDGGSADGTERIAEAAGARLVRSARGRGVQLRAGAAAAQGDWLLFLHADTLLSAQWRESVAVHVASAPDKAACFRFRLDDASWQARLIERGVRARRFPYGDQGLLLSRALYDAVGGYRPLPLMEDVDLVRRIGRRRLSLLGAEAITSAARWRRDGWARRSARNAGLLLLYRLGASPERLAKLYG